MTAYTYKILPTLLLVLLLTPVLGYSKDIKKQYYFMGGGGEPEGESTIFDGDLGLVAKFISKSDWDATVSFNGGHKKTEEIVKNKMSKARNAGSFVEKTYNDLIEEMINKIKSGELSSGDQLLVNINTHGARSTNKDKTHKVAVAFAAATNLNDLQGARTVSLDRLETLINLSAEAGVKLAIVDVSCFSGNTLNIKNDKVCMISASGSEQYGYAGKPISTFFGNYTYTFGSEFFDSFKKGRNLEDIYLRARTAGASPDFPMISSPEGQAINEMMYKMITPYLSYNEGSTTDFSDQYSNDSQKFEERSCNFKNNYEQFQGLIKQLNQMSSTVEDLNSDKSSEFSQLKNALEKYRNYQLRYEQSLRTSLEANKEILETLNKKFPGDKKLWEAYNPITLLNTDVEASLKYWQKNLDDSSAKNSAATNKWLSEIVQNLKKKQDIINYVKENLSPESKKKLSDQADFYSKSGVTFDLAKDVSVAAKKVYNKLYKDMKTTKSNPCRDFVL